MADDLIAHALVSLGASDRVWCQSRPRQLGCLATKCSSSLAVGCRGRFLEGGRAGPSASLLVTPELKVDRQAGTDGKAVEAGPGRRETDGNNYKRSQRCPMTLNPVGLRQSRSAQRGSRKRCRVSVIFDGVGGTAGRPWLQAVAVSLATPGGICKMCQTAAMALLLSRPSWCSSLALLRARRKCASGNSGKDEQNGGC